MNVKILARPRVVAAAGAALYLTFGSTQAFAASTPYFGNPAAMPGTIQAEHYDQGGQNVAYYDQTSTHVGAAFRTSDRVDLVTATGSATGYVINNFQTGEWLAYAINAPAAGAYDVELSAATRYADSTVRILLDGQNVSGSVRLPVATSWDSFSWVAKTRINLTAGRHDLRIYSEKQYFNLDAIRISNAPANLLFKSGFDGGSMSLIPPVDCWGTGCWQELVGLDSLSGHTWPGNVWGGGGKFLMLSSPVVTTPATVGNYLFNRFENMAGPRGNQSTVLRQQISQNVNGTAPMGTSPTQNEFQFLPPREAGDMYLSYWVKLQPDMVTKMNNLPAGPGISGGGTWRALFALKTGGQTTWGGPADNGDYRIEAYVMTYGGGQPYWTILGDNAAGGGAPLVNGWRVENRTVPVPVNQWIKLEFFWHRSSGADGRVWMAANGQVIADRRGANMGAWNLPINRIMAPMLYAGSAMPIYQWVDDVEVWDGFPAPGSNPPYAAH
jgi:hypothetical protein